jgi:hypothetical protein
MSLANDMMMVHEGVLPFRTTALPPTRGVVVGWHSGIGVPCHCIDDKSLM